jgi:hypothetical protein
MSNSGSNRMAKHKDASNNLPEIFVDLNEHDVMLGRGAFCIHYVGNLELRDVCYTRRHEYNSTNDRKRKAIIAGEIMSMIRSRGGRFLRQATEAELRHSGLSSWSRGWILAETAEVLEKIKKILRDKHFKISRVTKEKRLISTISNDHSRVVVHTNNHSRDTEDEKDVPMDGSLQNTILAYQHPPVIRTPAANSSAQFVNQRQRSLESNFSMSQGIPPFFNTNTEQEYGNPYSNINNSLDSRAQQHLRDIERLQHIQRHASQSEISFVSNRNREQYEGLSLDAFSSMPTTFPENYTLLSAPAIPGSSDTGIFLPSHRQAAMLYTAPASNVLVKKEGSNLFQDSYFIDPMLNGTSYSSVFPSIDPNNLFVNNATQRPSFGQMPMPSHHMGAYQNLIPPVVEPNTQTNSIVAAEMTPFFLASTFPNTSTERIGNIHNHRPHHHHSLTAEQNQISWTLPPEFLPDPIIFDRVDNNELQLREISGLEVSDVSQFQVQSVQKQFLSDSEQSLEQSTRRSDSGGSLKDDRILDSIYYTP